MKTRMVIGGLLMLPFFGFFGAYWIHDIWKALKKGDYLGVIIPAIFCMAILGAICLSEALK